MTERIIIVLVAFAAGVCVLVAVNAILALFFDEDMRRRKVWRAAPGDTYTNGVARYGGSAQHPNRGWADCILCGGPQHYGRCDNPERVS